MSALFHALGGGELGFSRASGRDRSHCGSVAILRGFARFREDLVVGKLLGPQKLSRLALGLGSRVISMTNVSPVPNCRRIRGTEPALWMASISSRRRGCWLL